MEYKINDYNFEVEDNLILKEYKYKLDKVLKELFQLSIKALIENNTVAHNEDIQKNINRLKDEYSFLSTTQKIGENTYKGILIKKSTNNNMVLNEEYCFESNKRLIEGNIHYTNDKLNIEKPKEVVFDFDIGDEDNGDVDEYKKIQDLVYQLYKLDKKYLIRKLLQLKLNMKMEDKILTYQNSKEVRTCLKFYDEMRSDHKTRITQKKRQPHVDAKKIACKHYEIPETLLQSLLGTISNFAKL